MSMQEIIEKARQIRDVIRYIKFFKNAVAVIYIDDDIIDSPILKNHIHDISLIREAGLKVIIVPGARKRINEVLQNAGISWEIKNGSRLTSPEAMPLIKMAAFDVSNTIMNNLAGDNLTAVIGNWVKARGKGVIDGTDYGTSGEIDKLQIEGIEKTLDDGFVPIFPCIGWNSVGKPYNISSLDLARQIAIHLQADKLFYILPDTQISNEDFVIPQGINLSPDNNIPAMNLEEVDLFLKQNQTGSDTDKNVNTKKAKILELLSLAKNACSNGVSRIHILNGNIEGIIPSEIFSGIGSGTMIYKDDYGGIRNMTADDISGVLYLMNPFVQKGILLQRTSAQLQESLDDFIVYDVDGGIHACAALHKYDGKQAEIAAVAVDEAYSNLGVGLKIIKYLVNRAREMNLESVFVLTTKTADWFEKQGFKPDSLESIPEARRKIWTPSRNSKVLRLMLD